MPIILTIRGQQVHHQSVNHDKVSTMSCFFFVPNSDSIIDDYTILLSENDLFNIRMFKV